MGTALLGADECAAVTLVETRQGSPLLITCDHAANRIPAALGDLGLSADDLMRHIAWDIGALGVAREIAKQLDATLIYQNYSRLVIDANRAPERDDSIPVRSEATDIPGNRSLGLAERQRRRVEIFEPYHAQIRSFLERRVQHRLPTVFVAIHSYTPVYLGESRPWDVGVLSAADRRMADIVLRELSRDATLAVGDNVPYSLAAGVDYSVPIHAEARRLLHVLIELRQDRIEHQAQQQRWGARLAGILRRAVDELLGTRGGKRPVENNL